MTQKEIFEKYPNLTHYYKVGDRTFLPAFEQEAKRFARSTNQKLTKVNPPKGDQKK